MTDGLQLRNVEIRRAGKPFLSIDCDVSAGEVLTIMGPSGSGKSTLLSFLTGDLPSVFQASGQIILKGVDITTTAPEKRQIGILFQDDLLFPHMSVGDNLAFGLAPGGTKDQRTAKIANALIEVGLEGFADRDPATLSGGQKSRVALIRMLLSNPNALLLDEAFSSLDSDRREQIRQLVFEQASTKNLPILMVTHDAEDARAAGGRVLKLD